MKNETINTTAYHILLADPKGEIPEPWLASIEARVETAADRIGLKTMYHSDWDGDTSEIDWVTHAVGKGMRYSTRQ